MEKALARNELVRALSHSTHGTLGSFVDLAEPYIRSAQANDEEFLARLIAWNERKGQIRDSKLALPVVHWTLTGNGAFQENAQAHLALRSPRELEAAWRFARTFDTPLGVRQLNSLVKKYLRYRESRPKMWDRAALQHRDSMRGLYALSHVKPSPYADAVLFKKQYRDGTVFKALQQMKHMTATEVAVAVAQFRIPFIPLQAALGKRMQDKDIAFALLDNMTPTELVTNQRLLEKMGVKTDPALRHRYREAMQKVSANTTANVLKTQQAADHIEDQEMKEVLAKVQATQIKKSAGVEGSWLVLADKSQSMHIGIEAGIFIAGHLAAMVKGEVHLVLFDNGVRYFNCTGRTLPQIKDELQHVRPTGGTSGGVGLQYMRNHKDHIVDGIVMVSDGETWQAPFFGEEYQKYCQFIGKELPVYFYQVGLGGQQFEADCGAHNIRLEKFDLRGLAIDYYAVPNLIQTMRVNPFSLSDEIFNTPLLKLTDVFN